MDRNRRKNAQKRVIVAMSGGLDSSVSAALLKRAGFDIIGIFMKFWSEPEKDGVIGFWNKCCSPDAERRARKIAEILNIPFYALDVRKEFKKEVVDYFIKEHKKGRTPNPCVVCNKEIKFGVLLKKALSLDADYIATGHYARLKEVNGEYHLFRAKDRKKDQSYFLWMLSQNQLKHILFPVGDYTKEKIRKLAKKLKLQITNIPESQEICFIQTTIYDFLKKHLKLKPGKIVNDKGEIIGEHGGLPLYTIGQRKGIGKSGGPYYVFAKNTEDNILIVTKNKKKLLKKEGVLEEVNWILGTPPKLPIELRIKIRYRHKGAIAVLSRSNKRYILTFKRAQRAVTPGQSAVFLRGEEILGGGIIT